MTNGEIANNSQISWPGSTSHNHQDDSFTLATSSVSLSGIPSSSLVQSADSASICSPKVLPLPVPSSISTILQTGLAPNSYIEAESGQEEEETVETPSHPTLPARLVLKVPAQTSELMSSCLDIPTRNTATDEQDSMNPNSVYSGAVVVQINNINEAESTLNHLGVPSPSSLSSAKKIKINSGSERSERSCDNVSLIAQQNLSRFQAVKQNEGLTEKVESESEDCASSRDPSETAGRQITSVHDLTAATTEDEVEEVRYTTLQQLRSKFESTREKEAPASASQIAEDKNKGLATTRSHLEYCEGEQQLTAGEITSGEAEVDRPNKEPGQLRRMVPTYQATPEFQPQCGPACVVTKPGERLPNKESLTLSRINVCDGSVQPDGQTQPSHLGSDGNEENAGKLSDIEGNMVMSHQANSEVRKEDVDDNPVSDETENVKPAEEAGRWAAEVRILNNREGGEEEGEAASSDSSLSSSDCETQVSLSLPSYSSTSSSYLARLDLHPEHCLQLCSLPEMFVDEDTAATLSDVSPISDCALTDLPCDNKSSQEVERGNISEETHQICDNKTEHYPDQDLHQPVNFYLRRSATPPIRNIENISTPNTFYSVLTLSPGQCQILWFQANLGQLFSISTLLVLVWAPPLTRRIRPTPVLTSPAPPPVSQPRSRARPRARTPRKCRARDRHL